MMKNLFHESISHTIITSVSLITTNFFHFFALNFIKLYSSQGFTIKSWHTVSLEFRFDTPGEGLMLEKKTLSGQSFWRDWHCGITELQPGEKKNLWQFSNFSWLTGDFKNTDIVMGYFIKTSKKKTSSYWEYTALHVYLETSKCFFS